jgi:hypothetical protein
MFPRSPAWGQAGFQEEGSVNPGTNTGDPQAVVIREQRDRKESTRYPAKGWAR